MPPTFTTGPLGLTLPDPADIIDVGIINGNMVKIDNQFGAADTIAVVPPDALVNAYPLGTSMFALTSASITTYPAWNAGTTATSAEVYNFKPASDRMTQFWFRNGSFTEGMYRHITASTQTAWLRFGDQDYAATNLVTDLTLPDNTWVQCSLTNQEMVEGYGLIYSGGGFTVRQKGVYTVECNAVFSGTVNTTSVNMGMGQSGDAGPSAFYRVSQANLGSNSATLNGTWTKAFNVNDTIFMFLLQQSGASKTSQTRRMTVRRTSWN